MSELEKPFKAFQQLLLSASPDFAAFHTYTPPLDSLEAAHFQLLVRGAKVLESQLRGGASPTDLAILLRQITRAFLPRGMPHLRLPYMLQEQLSEAASKMSLTFAEDGSLRAHNWESKWLPDSGSIDQLMRRRPDESVVSNGVLYAMTGFPTYRSQAQESAVAAALFAPTGSTTLITLPTGGGKSMCILLPAWLDSAGGRRANGTTIVVVPTVALALDQLAGARRHFTSAAGEMFKPQCLTSDTSAEKRKLIYQGIADGSLPILYAAPESFLLNAALYYACIKAAKAGTLKRIIVDEAHLVDSWGANFRPEFQLLGAFCNTLRTESGNQFITLLLSATVTQQAQETLQAIFAPNQELRTVLANRLRPEPSFWVSNVKSRPQQTSQVVEAIHHLPRPLILYVTQRREAKRWLDVLRNEGYTRVVDFTGATSTPDRDATLRKWRTNQLDIIVATSAFGVGVDKADVRTVIHATIPENIDRFYQEVGRGGRDGNSSISLLVACDKDFDTSYRMQDRLISVELAWSRWQGMWQVSGHHGGNEDQWLLNLNAKPLHNVDMSESDALRHWNEHVLLMMQRAKMLIVEAVRPNEAPLPAQHLEEARQTENNFWVQVCITDNTIVDNEIAFGASISEQRQTERDEALNNLGEFHRIVKQLAEQTLDDCIAMDFFAELYPNVARACGGCPVCRTDEMQPFCDPLMTEYEVNENELNIDNINYQLRRWLTDQQRLLIKWDTHQLPELILAYTGKLITAGIQQVILPHSFTDSQELALLQSLLIHRFRPHRLLTFRPNRSQEHDLLLLPTVVFLDNDPTLAEETFEWVYDRFEFADVETPAIYFVNHQLELPSLFGLLTEKIEGQVIPPKKLLKQLRRSNKLLF
ncbi:MAG: protein DpdF [Candidatus Promineifilaceae bacterium]